VVTCHPLINKIQHAVVWGQKSNLMSVPTDCPQRDERLGWMGDAALTGEEANLNFRMGALYSHWLDIIRDDQNKDGSVTNVVPSLRSTSPGAPNWQTAYPTLLWVLYRYNGDKDLIQDHWVSLQAYIAFFDKSYQQTGIKNFFTGFGDWVPPPPAPSANGHFVGAFAYLHDLVIYAEMADGIGQETVAKDVRQRLQGLIQEFNTAFYDSSKKMYGTGLQTETAMALWLHAVPADDLGQVLNNLANDILKTHDVHPTTGILGWRYLLDILTEYSMSDIGIQLNLQNTYPSIGYMLEGNGNMEPATTLWELWNSDVSGPSMNSRNHIMFGSVGTWLYKTILGISPSPADSSISRNTGFDHVTVGPDAYIVNSFNTTSASGRVTTPHGIIEVQWSVPTTSSACQTVAENGHVDFTCGAGTITGFKYAFYGTPTGDCVHGFKKGQCDSANALSAVEKVCVGKSSCEVPINNNFFGGDPCNLVQKLFSGQVMCSIPVLTIPYQLNVVIPIGSTADVLIPIVPSLNQTVMNFIISEGKSSFWKSQTYIPGVMGITGANLNAMKTAVIVNVMSGSYSFTSH